MKRIKTTTLGVMAFLGLLSCSQEEPQSNPSTDHPNSVIPIEADFTIDIDQGEELKALFHTDANSKIILGNAGVALPEGDELKAVVSLISQHTGYSPSASTGSTEIILRRENGKFRFKGLLFLDSFNNDRAIGGTYYLMAALGASNGWSFPPAGDSRYIRREPIEVIGGGQDLVASSASSIVDLNLLYIACAQVSIRSNNQWRSDGSKGAGGELKVSHLRFKPRGQVIGIQIKNSTASAQTISAVKVHSGFFTTQYHYMLDEPQAEINGTSVGSNLGVNGRGAQQPSQFWVIDGGFRHKLHYGFINQSSEAGNAFMTWTRTAGVDCKPFVKTLRLPAPITLPPGSTSGRYYMVVSPLGRYAEYYKYYYEEGENLGGTPTGNSYVNITTQMRSTRFEIFASGSTSLGDADINGRGTEIYSHNYQDHVVNATLTLN